MIRKELASVPAGLAIRERNLVGNSAPGPYRFLGDSPNALLHGAAGDSDRERCPHRPQFSLLAPSHHARRAAGAHSSTSGPRSISEFPARLRPLRQRQQSWVPSQDRKCRIHSKIPGSRVIPQATHVQTRLLGAWTTQAAQIRPPCSTTYSPRINVINFQPPLLRTTNWSGLTLVQIPIHDFSQKGSSCLRLLS